MGRLLGSCGALVPHGPPRLNSKLGLVRRHGRLEPQLLKPPRRLPVWKSFIEQLPSNPVNTPQDCSLFEQRSLGHRSEFFRVFDPRQRFRRGGKSDAFLRVSFDPLFQREHADFEGNEFFQQGLCLGFAIWFERVFRFVCLFDLALFVQRLFQHAAHGDCCWAFAKSRCLFHDPKNGLCLVRLQTCHKVRPALENSRPLTGQKRKRTFDMEFRMPDPLEEALIEVDVEAPAKSKGSSLSDEKVRELLSRVMETVGSLEKQLKDAKEQAKASDSKPERDPSQAMYVTMCPYGTIPCDEKKMGEMGFKCPYDKAPNPLIFDSDGNLCMTRGDIAAANDDVPQNIAAYAKKQMVRFLQRVDRLFVEDPERATDLIATMRKALRSSSASA